MIAQIFDEKQFCALPEEGVEAQKIRALLNAYGLKYDFCRFYISEDCFISILDSFAVLCADKADYSELADFFRMSGVSEVFCSAYSADELCRQFPFNRKDINCMRFMGTPQKTEIDYSPSLQECYDILSTSFSLDHDSWYLDMSHRIRHGVTRLSKRGHSCLCIQHTINGEALLSQIATIPEYRNRGEATALILGVCDELREYDIFVICEDELVPFYQKLGFQFVEKKSVLT